MEPNTTVDVENGLTVLVDVVAREFHEHWCRSNPLSSLANVSYQDLSEQWKQENWAAAVTAFEAVELAASNGVPENEMIENAAEFIHDRWVERNKHRAPATLVVPYSELPESEKNKDRMQARLAFNVLCLRETSQG